MAQDFSRERDTSLARTYNTFGMIAFVCFWLFMILVPGGSDNDSPASSDMFAGLYEEYMPRVYRLVRYRIDDKGTAEDLTSTVFEKALIVLKRYSSDGDEELA